MFDAKLLDLPWVTLVTLVTGYIGYFIANVGVKDHHQPLEIAFSTLVFGLLSSFPYNLTIAAHWLPASSRIYVATLTALAFALVVGIVWRKWGRRLMYRVLRKYDISWSDNTSSAWQQLFDQRNAPVYELTVYLKNGVILLSRDMATFDGLPNGPCTLGNKGDVILYVTHRYLPGKKEWQVDEHVTNERYGSLATYVPADQIARLEIRRACLAASS